MTAPNGAQAAPVQADAAPDLLYSEAEDDLRAAVRSLLTDRGGPAAVLADLESGRTHDTGLWRSLAADMGTAGLLVPEKLGGQGASAREAAVVLEELGRSVAPVPYLTSAVVAVTALLGCETDARKWPDRSPRSPKGAASACSPCPCRRPRAPCRNRPYGPTRTAR